MPEIQTGTLSPRGRLPKRTITQAPFTMHSHFIFLSLWCELTLNLECNL